MSTGFKIPKTEKELEGWMKENCYNFNSYSIGGNEIYEGFGIEKSGGLFIWYYTERGQKEQLKYFYSEEEIIRYAFNKIQSDEWANAHCIGFTENKATSKELAEILTHMSIRFMEDEIPFYGIEKPVYRNFVFGCDELKTKQLKEKYLEVKD